jgi:hypothetical protein
MSSMTTVAGAPQLGHATPVPSERAGARSAPNVGRLRRCDVLGGLIHEYGTQHDTPDFWHHTRRRPRQAGLELPSAGRHSTGVVVSFGRHMAVR